MPAETRSKIAHAIKPMLAEEVEKPFSGKDWIFETKWDGYRAIAVCGKKQTLLYSRNGISFENQYPSIFRALQQIKVEMTIDGEISALDKNGKSDFQLLQEYKENPDITLRYFVFDILEFDHKDVKNLTLLERKALLKRILPKSREVIYCAYQEDNGLSFFKEVQLNNLEGMMAKRKDSKYLAGQRTSLWLKVKNQHTEEVVIAGFTAPRGTRKRFGALLLGIYRKGKLVYAGHTGTGFTFKLLEELYEKMIPLTTDQPAFDIPTRKSKDVTWIKPRLVANIRFTEWTKEGLMRHPVFQGLRMDKTIHDMKFS